MAGHIQHNGMSVTCRQDQLFDTVQAKPKQTVMKNGVSRLHDLIESAQHAGL